MGEIKPQIFFPPLIVVGIDALSIGVEYLQESFIREMIDSQVPSRRLLCILINKMACGKSVSRSWLVASIRTIVRQWASFVLDVSKL